MKTFIAVALAWIIAHEAVRLFRNRHRTVIIRWPFGVKAKPTGLYKLTIEVAFNAPSANEAQQVAGCYERMIEETASDNSTVATAGAVRFITKL